MQESFKIPTASFPSVSGAVCSFDSQYAGLPLKSHKIALTATQSGSGTPSPDNVRTINGYSAINISQSGADTSTPTVYIINLGGTYYGGEYDARTGVLTVTHGYYEFNGLESWNVLTGSFWQANLSLLGNAKPVGMFLSSIGVVGKFVNNTYLRIYYADNTSLNINDNTDMNTLFANGTNCVYELATLQTIQLPPCPIDTLEGVNNIWADTGDTTLQYPKFG